MASKSIAVLVFFCLSAALGANANATAGWTEPSGAPPSNNVPAPLSKDTNFLGDITGKYNNLKINIPLCEDGQVLTWQASPGGVICSDPTSNVSLLEVLTANDDASTFIDNTNGVRIGDATHATNLYVKGGEITAKWLHAIEPTGQSDFAGDVQLMKNLILPVSDSAGTVGVIYAGSNPFIHTVGGDSTSVFVGANAGNFNLIMAYSYNTGIGYRALQSVVKLTGGNIGVYNTAVGANSLLSNTIGTENTAVGVTALRANTTAGANTAVGFSALFSNITGGANTAIGHNALMYNTDGSNNVALGTSAGDANKTGSKNVFIGDMSGPDVATPINNSTAIGYNARVAASNSLVLGGTGANAVNVGIGITAPSQKLDISGGLKIGAASDPSTAGTISYTDGDFWGFNGIDWKSLTLTGASLPVGTAGQTLRSDGTNWLANSIITNNGANVGIGTASPSEKLTVDGKILLIAQSGPVNYSLSSEANVGSPIPDNRLILKSSSNKNRLWLDTTGPSSGSVISMASNGQEYLAVGDASLFYDGSIYGITVYQGKDFIIRTGTTGVTTEKFRLTTGGNVGIGTAASPAYKLDVATAVASDRGINVAVTATAGINYGGYFSNTGSGAGVNTGVYTVASGGTFNFGIYDITAAASQSYSIYSVGGAQSYFKGNVGIGTASPSTALHIGSDGTTITLGGGTNVANAITFSAGRTIVGYNGTNAYLQGGNTKGLSLIVNAVTTALQIDSAGNVGIGTTGPTQKLDIFGGLKIGPSSGGAAGTISFSNGDFWGTTDGTTWKSFTTSAGGSVNGTANHLAKFTGATAVGDSQIIDNGINVIIGQSDIGLGKLQITAPITTGITVPLFLKTNDFVFGGSGSALEFYFGTATENTYSALQAYGTGGKIVNNLILQPVVGSNVGIGTDAPTEKLDINSDSIRIRTSKTPVQGSACDAGEISWNVSYIYVCTATKTWKRATLSTYP